MSVRESAIALLTNWETTDCDQDALRHAVLAFLHARPDSCMRSCVAGHITASTLVVDDSAQKVLLTLHPRFGRWLQLGGHCEDTDIDIFGAALREATEESGITDLHLHPNLAAVHVHSVTCSLGVPTRHLDLQFIATAAPGAEIAISDESLDLRWWPIDQLPDGTDAGLIRLVDAASRRWSSGSRNPG